MGEVPDGSSQTATYSFLQGGGEMGALTRNFDWSRTALGPVATWPQSLKTTLGIVLNSRFPMFLWWGPGLISFYNDAYRPSLGNEGKHPGILGAPAREAWPEIWDVIRPLIEQVLAGGGATWSEDQLIPIYRNGRIEDAYWTFSYSPVHDEQGTVAGVLVTCSETTDKVKMLTGIKARERQLNFTIDAAALGTWDLNPATNTFTGNERLKKWFGLPLDADIPLSAALDAIATEDRERVVAAKQRAMSPGSDGNYETEYTIRPAHAPERRLLAKGRADFDPATGLAIRFSGTLEDITQRNRVKKELQESEMRFRDTVHQAPMGITLLSGPQHIVQVANKKYLELVDKSEAEFVGKPLFDTLPEVKEVVAPLLAEVLQSGEPFTASGFAVQLKRHGALEEVFFDFVYHPLEKDGRVESIMVVATEVTSAVKARYQLAESERQFRNMVMQSSIPMTILRGPDHVVEMANKVMFDTIWAKKPEEVLGRPLLEIFPELNGQKYVALLSEVLTTGRTHKELESEAYVNGNAGMRRFDLDFEYAPLFEQDGTVSGIIVTVNDVTEKVAARKKVEESEGRLASFISIAPFPIGVYTGPDLRIEVANQSIRDIWGKGNDVIGKLYGELLPELEQQGVIQQLREVYEKGLPYHAYNKKLELIVAGKPQVFYFNYSFTPLFDTDGNVYAVMNTAADVTELNLAKQKIEESEDRWNIVIDASELGTWELDVKTDKIVYSERLKEIFGVSKDQTAGHPDLVALIHPEDIPIREAAFKEAFRTGVLQYSARIIRPDNSICWMEGRGKVFFDKEGKPAKMIGAVRDITEEKHFQHKLQESERKFRLLADSMPQFVWTADEEGQFDYFNQAIYNATGLNRDTLTSAGWLEVVHPDERKNSKRLWELSVRSGKEFILEHRIRMQNGSYRWQLSRAIAQTDLTGRIHMWVGTSTDIQEQKMFEQELRLQVEERTRELELLNHELTKSEQRYHLMVSEVQDYAIIYLNTGGFIENWNKGAETIKGYEAEEIIGKHFSIFYTDQDRQNSVPEKLLQQARETGRVQQDGMRVRKDGSLFWAHVVITAIHGEGGSVIGFSKVTHDLTMQKQAEDELKLYSEQLEQKNRELEKMNSELQSFAYISSHDLQEPLRKIQIFAGRIIEKELENLSEKGKGYFQRMQESANRMQVLIQDLLTYSRTNNTDSVFVRTDLTTILEQVKADLRETIVEKKVRIESDQLCTLDVIPFQINQLLHNLIGNAIKFARKDVPAHITIMSAIVKGKETGIETLAPEKAYCRIVISDNGIGFDPEYKERIFDVFQRLHEKDEYSGTGIGLAIVKKIVENHHGHISASSAPDQGADFTIYLPA